MKKSKILALVLVAALALTALAGCGGTPAKESPAASGSAAGTAAPAPGVAIAVTSREEGSGTRGAFIELFGIEKKNEAGEKVDYTIDEADQTNSTGVMLQTIAQDEAAIGYVSLGALNDTVKALDVDGVAATIENIKNNSYKIARPFNIVTKEGLSASAQDFIDFILSADGQAVIEANGYIPISDAPAYAGKGATEKVTVGGSSSVYPVMEKLIEAYTAVNKDSVIELQVSDSTTGVSDTLDGVCNIGMASRELKDSEKEAGAIGTVIAMDGIAVIVNPNNAVSAITSEQVMGIYTGTITDWSEIK